MTYLNNDTEAFPMDDLGNRVGQVTQRDGVGNAHRDAASRHGVLRPDITATNRIHLSVNDMKNSVDELTNRYTAIDSNSLAYDDAGSLTQDKDGYRTTYDYENRPVRVAKLDGQTEVTVATFAYDALGRRICKQDAIAGTTSLYYYSDNWQVLAEYDGSGVLQASYAYGNYIDEVLLMRRGGADYFYLHDHLYSPAALLAGTGAVVERYEYDVYGTCHIQAPDFSLRTASLYGNSFLFQGHMQDNLDSGSLKPYDFRYRAYDSFAGRWMQQDPLGVNSTGGKLNPYIPQKQYADGLSLYVFVQGNPIIFGDPSGLQSESLKQCEIGGEKIALEFDGSSLHGGGINLEAVSGRPIKRTVVGHRYYPGIIYLDYSVEFDYSVERQKLHSVGGIPSGEYRLDICEESSAFGYGFRRQSFRHWYGISAWGLISVPLHAESGTETYGRGGFFIHGGSYWGSAGCIDIKNNDLKLDALFEKAYVQNCKCCYIPVSVRYKQEKVVKYETEIYNMLD